MYSGNIMSSTQFLKAKTALFAEDDMIAREQTTKILEMLFQKVYVASDGEDAWKIYSEEPVDIIITDIKMPRRDGISLIELIRRENYSIPIILISSYTEEDLLMGAVNLSVDRYLVKPLNLEKFVTAIVHAFSRIQKLQEIIPLGKNYFFHMATKELFKEGEQITLGVKEMDLLALLIEKKNYTVTYEEMLFAIWSYEKIGESTLKNTVLRIRKKIYEDLIISVRNVGYRINLPIEPNAAS